MGAEFAQPAVSVARSGRQRKPAPAWLQLAVGLLAFDGSAPARSLESLADPLPVSRVRAGFVLNFLRFTEWPKEAFTTDSSPVVVAVVDDPDLAADLRTLVQGERIGASQRTISVLPVSLPDAGGFRESELESRLRDSHLVFVGREDERHLRLLLESLQARPVLTVSDLPEFAEKGGMLGLVVRNGRMTFDVAPDRIRDAGIELSSKVLRLGRIVDSGTR